MVDEKCKAYQKTIEKEMKDYTADMKSLESQLVNLDKKVDNYDMRCLANIKQEVSFYKIPQELYKQWFLATHQVCLLSCSTYLIVILIDE